VAPEVPHDFESALAGDAEYREELIMNDLDIQDLVDRTSRTHLLLAHLGIIEQLKAAGSWLGRRTIHLEVGADACEDEFAQAAAFTIVTLARRASIPVSVSLAHSESRTLTRVFHDELFVGTLERLGAVSHDPIEGSVILGIGTVTAGVSAPEELPRLQITWDGWVGAVRPLGDRLAERPGCILAAVAAAALAVSEVFQHLLGHLDAGWRPVTVSLWEPTSVEPARAVGPVLARLPDQWFIVGLGHLGQAYAWCVALLPYARGEGEVWLSDDDVATEANISTGVITRHKDITDPPQRKTRLVDAFVSSAGRTTRMIECRLPSSYRWEPTHPDVALIGVDNLGQRLRLSEIGWPLCIDAGLGSGPTSFASMSLHIFPGTISSRRVAAWQANGNDLPDVPPAIRSLANSGLDTCGLVTLAGQAVGAAFVGMIAACFAVTEPIRRLHGSPGLNGLGLSLDHPQPRGARGSELTRTGSIPVDSIELDVGDHGTVF
jgi:hypothetical protein